MDGIEVVVVVDVVVVVVVVIVVVVVVVAVVVVVVGASGQSFSSEPSGTQWVTPSHLNFMGIDQNWHGNWLWTVGVTGVDTSGVDTFDVDVDIVDVSDERKTKYWNQNESIWLWN